MSWYRTSAGANGVNSYVNDYQNLLSVTGTTPNFTISLSTPLASPLVTALAGGPYATAALAEAALLTIIHKTEERVIDPSAF